MFPSLARRLPPTRILRLFLAVAVGAAGAAIHLLQQRARPDHPGDFGVAWFGARMLFEGRNPYRLIGPGLEYEWPWAPLYPATAMVVAMPVAMFEQLLATMLFVGISAALFTFAITRDGWSRLPVLVSYPFIIAVAAAQWSPLVASAFFLPVVGSVLIAKPTLGGAVAFASDWATQRAAVLGGLVILALSFWFMPHWFGEWRVAVGRDMSALTPPMLRRGGFVLLLALLRWRQPEARLLLVMAIVPQTSSWYEIVPLFIVARTANESMVLAIFSSLGWLSQDYLMTATNGTEFISQVGHLMLAFGYIPALIIVLRRSNASTTVLPPYMRWLGPSVRRTGGAVRGIVARWLSPPDDRQNV
jgi:hypothetical protein